MLRRHVCVHDDRGQAHQFGPGDDVPAWARKQITNPRAWDETPGRGGLVDGPEVSVLIEHDEPVATKATARKAAAAKAPTRRAGAKKAADPDAGDGQ